MDQAATSLCSSRPPCGSRAAAATSTEETARGSSAGHKRPFKPLCVNNVVSKASSPNMHDTQPSDDALGGNYCRWHVMVAAHNTQRVANCCCTQWWHSSGTVVAHSSGTERGGGAQNTRHVWKSRGWFCRLAIGRDPMVPANERRALGGGGESFHLEAYCSASRPYLLNNWSIVENNSIYEALPRVVEKVSLKVRFRCRGSSGGGQSGKCLICTGHRSTEVQHWVQLLRSAAKSL